MSSSQMTTPATRHSSATRSLQFSARSSPAIARLRRVPARGRMPFREQIETVRLQRLNALGGGPEEDKKFITRDEEPEQFWQTKTEKKGQNPAQDPLALIGIAGLLLPFIILGIAIATGVVDISKGKL